MKRLQKQPGKRHLPLLALCLMGASLLLCPPVWGIDTPGLSLAMYGDPTNPEHKFSRGEKVPLTMVIRNDTGFPLSTERGFAKYEPQRFLVLLDPAGTQHVVGGNVMSGDAPPPFFLGTKTTIPAETLPADWVKSVVIEDLTELFPVMKDAVGWYTLEAHIPFTRMVWIIRDAQIGLLGVEDDRNWKGTLDSNTIQFEIALPPTVRGALLKVQVMDQSIVPPLSIGQIPVRVYEAESIAGLSLAEAWATGPTAAALVGITNTDGQAVWVKNLCKTEKDYVAIAYDSIEYRAVPFAAGEEGWTLQCEGEIEKVIYFGEISDKNYLVTGGAYKYPQADIHQESVSLDVSTENANPSGWLKFYDTRTRLFFLSTGITEITVSQGNAAVKGAGTVNGAQGFTFEALVVDGSPDKFGFTIRDANGGTYHSSVVQDINGGDLFIIVKAMANKSIADLDGDGDSDGKDMVNFISAYGMGAVAADMNNDESVDANDLDYLAERFGLAGDSDENGIAAFAPEQGSVMSTLAAPLAAEPAGVQSVRDQETAAPDENIELKDSDISEEKKKKKKRKNKKLKKKKLKKKKHHAKKNN